MDPGDRARGTNGMHAPNPDPRERPQPVDNAGGTGSSAPQNGSTGSHREGIPEPSLSDALRSNSSSTRGASAADMVAHIPLPVSTDDAPTVITQAGKNSSNSPSSPPLPHVVGDSKSIAGRKLGHFELIEAIGAGGMAAVLKARDLELGRIVALKILPPESALDPENVTRFKQEARAAAKLDHDNVARVYFCGEDQALHFIAFEFVEGITLRQTIDWRGPLSTSDAVRYMIQVAAGLAHASERGVVHRDIKPSNILITPDGKAKIVDMGLARHLESQSVNGGVTQSGVTLGTFDYISPEQALDPRQADVRSDIYSLGCTFYHALTGRPPVPEGTAAKKLHAHHHVAPLDPRELNSSIPDEVAAVLARMMAKDPGKRYQTPAELIAHLKSIAERLRISLESVASDATVQAVAADEVLPHVPRLRLSWVAAAASIVAAVVAIVVAANGPDFASPSPNWASGDTGPKLDSITDTGSRAKQGIANPEEPRVATAESLAAALASAKTNRIHLASGTFDLTKLGKAVAFQGSELELIGSPNHGTVIRLSAPSGKRADSPGSLTIAAGSLTIRGIRFEIAPPADGDDFSSDLIGLAVNEASKVTLEDCSFFPSEAARKAMVAGIGVNSPAADGIHLNRCLFAPGGIGLRVSSRTNVEILDSGFGPHASAIQIRDDGNPEESQSTRKSTLVRFDRASFMLDPGCAAVDVDESASLDVSISARYCVFAPANGAVPDAKVSGMETPARGAIVRNSARKRTVKVQALPGQWNAYYGVAAVSAAAKSDGFGVGWVKLDRRPWDPAGKVLEAFATSEPWTAFRLTLTGPGAERAVFVPQNDEWRVLGAQCRESINLRRVYGDSIWPPSRPAAAEITTRVWWPNAPEGQPLKPGEYADLVTLLRAARSGDTILIRHSGPLLLSEQYVIKPPKPAAGAVASDYHLTFKPESKDDKPILIPAPTGIIDLSLFQVVEGRVTFEGLHFALNPGDSQKTLAAVTVATGRGCEFIGCTFTLDELGSETTTVVSLPDPGSVMKMEGPASRAVPDVKFTGCLIRGKGRAVSLPVSRSFALEMSQCITALNGPVIYAKTAGRDLGSPDGSSIHLSRVTALLGGPFVELQGGSFGVMKAHGLVQTTITADHCLFAAVPGAGQPMVSVKDTEFDRMDPNGVVKWTAPEANRFANFELSSPGVVVKPDASSTQNWKWNEWFQFSKEVGVGKVEFEDEPDSLQDLSNLKPLHARVKKVELPNIPGAEPGDAGADPDRVANPPEEKKNTMPNEP
jgi:serine/threonine protein kinase